jgi:hypothetical protein
LGLTLDGLLDRRRMHSLFGTARRAKHRRLLAQPRLPIDDAEHPAGCQDLRGKAR